VEVLAYSNAEVEQFADGAWHDLPAGVTYSQLKDSQMSKEILKVWWEYCPFSLANTRAAFS
jgi:hypothetical protein